MKLLVAAIFAFLAVSANAEADWDISLTTILPRTEIPGFWDGRDIRPVFYPGDQERTGRIVGGAVVTPALSSPQEQFWPLPIARSAHRTLKSFSARIRSPRPKPTSNVRPSSRLNTESTLNTTHKTWTTTSPSWSCRAPRRWTHSFNCQLWRQSETPKVLLESWQQFPVGAACPMALPPPARTCVPSPTTLWLMPFAQQRSA